MIKLLTLMLTLIGFLQTNLHGQCVGCTITITGSDASTYSLNPGDKLCITATGNFTGNLNVWGGEICNLGTCDVPNLSMSAGTIDNQGTFGLHTINYGGPSTFNNSGTVNATSSTGYFGGIFNNDGTFNHSGSITFQGMEFINNSYVNIVANLTNNSPFTNNFGTITIGGNFTASSPVINNACIDVVGDFTNLSNFQGPNTGCGGVSVGGVTNNQNNFGVIGTLDLCDAGNPVGGWDIQNSIVGASTTYCGCSCNAFPLPITLIEFEAEKENKKTKTSWTTVSELNNDYFSIQRSKDAITFEQIGTVKGAGNSTNTLNYVFYDENPYQGLSYYRLKQVDFNGDFSYSEIKVVNFAPLEFIQIYPNPSDSWISIIVGSPKDMIVNITVFNSIGQKVINYNEEIIIGHTKIVLNTKKLSTGNYIFKVTTPIGEHIQKEFIKK